MPEYANMWVPEGVAQEEIIDIREGTYADGQVSRRHKFTFKHRDKIKTIYVWAESDAPQSQIEDCAAKGYESWLHDMNQEEYKRPPTADEKKQIGRAINDFHLARKKRRESSNNRLFYQGVR